MARKDPYRLYLEMPEDELERKVALLYEGGLLELQERMHPGSTLRPTGPGIHIQGASGQRPVPGQGETPAELAAHGRKVMTAMMAPVRPMICREVRAHPDDFQAPSSGLPHILDCLTRVRPPDDLFVAAACLLWRSGLREWCAGAEAEA